MLNQDNESAIMYKHYKAKISKAIVMYFDVFLVLSLFITIREYLLFDHFINIETFYRIEFTLWHVAVVIALGFLWNRIFVYMKMYHFREGGSFGRKIMRVFIAASIGVTTILFCANLIGVKGIGGKFPLVFWIITVYFFLLYRSIFLGFLQYMRSKQKNIRHVLIAGVNERSIRLAAELKKPELGYSIIGFTDDETNPKLKTMSHSKPLVCSLNGLDSYLSNNPVDEVLITLPIRSYYDRISQIIDSCAIQGIKTRLVTNFFELDNTIRPLIENDAEASYIKYEVDSRSELQYDFKRLMDIVVASICLIIFSPVFLIVSFMIYLDDGFPIFFIQERVGLNKRRFKMIKFRTMVKNAEEIQIELETLNEVNGAAFKITNDPRILKIGHFLRKSSLDELPQFLNVLSGSMSLVGPRPLPIRDFKRFYKNSHRRRFSVKPGITGLWQISGRSSIDFEEWMRLDLQYIDNWSILMELKILLRTIPAVIYGKGAK